MQLHERDFLLTKIISGYTNHRVNNKKIKYSHTISNDLVYEASEIYYDTYNLSKSEGLMDDKEIYNFLCNVYHWSDDDENRLNVSIPDYIDNCKVEMYRNYQDKDYLLKARKYIDRADEELDTLFNKKHSLDHLSCHGTASYAKYQFIVENSIEDIDSLSQLEIVDIMELNNKTRPSEESIREISRTEPWRSLWYISKKVPIFSSAFKLSDEQRRLIQWSLTYDSVYENQDVPPEEVINDDYLLDGWFLVKRREIKRDKKREEIEKRLGNNKNAGEIFVMAKNEEDAKDILDMNDDISKNIISRRIEVVKKYGEISHDKLDDVKQELQMQYNNNVRDYHARR